MRRSGGLKLLEPSVDLYDMTMKMRFGADPTDPDLVLVEGWDDLSYRWRAVRRHPGDRRPPASPCSLIPLTLDEARTKTVPWPYHDEFLDAAISAITSDLRDEQSIHRHL